MTKLYKDGVPVKEIAIRFGVQNPAVWKALRRTGVLPPYAPRQTGGQGRPVGGGTAGYTDNRLARAAAAVAEREAKEPPRPVFIIDRTPCFKCGIRGDIGCVHRSVN